MASLPRATVAAAVALSAGGCSFSYRLDSLFGGDDAKPEQTGSIATPANTDGTKKPVSDADLEYARMAATEVLSRGAKDASAPWSNPETGARGTVTPIAAAYTQDGFVCRDFLASYVRQGLESWLQGEACRQHQGKWVVRSLKPWKRS
jgi:surface antigen